MEGGGLGSSQELLERLKPDQNSSVVKKLQQKYWRTKQTLLKVSGRKEDQHLVASDAQLDGKLEVFHSIQRTCMELLKVTEQYQRRICSFSQEENQLGVFLRAQGSRDRTRAGKIMQATGKALCFSSQQRLSLRNPLCRLYQEVETFRYRAISDTWLTVNQMEQARTEYRGALLWMKDVSQELDPDTHKQMEKFRKVQAQVRTSKTSFDKLKNDVCQKVDLLGASRCNLLSHVLTTYQTSLLHFWEKTSHKLAAIHESFRGGHHSAFSSVQESTDTESSRAGRQEEETAEETAKQLVSAGGRSSSDSRDGDNTVPPTKTSPGGPKAGSSDAPELDGDKDILALLEEILGCSSLEEGDLPPDWKDPFGDGEEASGSFLPSQLLDHSFTADASPGGVCDAPRPTVPDQTGLRPQRVSQATKHTSGAAQNPTGAPMTEAPGGLAPGGLAPGGLASGGATDLAAWFSLFADLDPLSNPDAVGRTDAELHQA